MDKEPTQKLFPLPPQPAQARFVPPKQPRKLNPWSRRKRIILSIVLLFFLLLGGIGAFAFYYIDNNILIPISHFIHPVSRGQDEPPVANYDEGSITGHAWNILLLGSDNDGKYNFPAVLTQVMMVIHIDPDHNTVNMVSIPRDSWVYVPEVGGMHKIDQAFFLGATKRNSFDDGVRLARLTIEKDYGITIDRYAWVMTSDLQAALTVPGVGAEPVGRARPPGGSSAPRPVRNAAFALLLSLMLGVAAAYALEWLDPRIRHVEAVDRVYGLNLVGVVPHAPPGGERDGRDPTVDRFFREALRTSAHPERSWSQAPSRPRASPPLCATWPWRLETRGSVWRSSSRTSTLRVWRRGSKSRRRRV